jgi:hypothetical protein
MNVAFDGVELLPADCPTPQHERVVHEKLAVILCALLGISPKAATPGGALHRPYYLPARTLVGNQAACLGIDSETRFFGGAVPAPFCATKAISHPLIPGGNAPAAWNPAFAELAHGALLPGWTAFSKADAARAGRDLLKQAPFRLKPVLATAGRGQQVIADARTLDQALGAMDDTQLERWGLVLEENLTGVETFSVGQVRIAGVVASYYGTQRLTQDNTGEQVYGGSDLTVYLGTYEALLESDLPLDVRAAITQAKVYEEAVERCYPGFIASRRNYDIAAGANHKGQRHIGVLEQSWRVGGASSAELLAMRAFQQNARLSWVKASTFEVFGTAQAPEDAQVFFCGEDADIGLMTKYARIQAHGYRQ